MEIAICPHCNKQIPEDAKFCPHCSAAVTSISYTTIFSWKWADKIFLFATILIFIAFFQPWFPGDILLQDEPLSAFQMLINIGYLEIDFLESYNILRMIVIVPFFALLVYLLVYLKRALQKSEFLPIFLFLIICVSIMPLLVKITGLVIGIILNLILLGAMVFYYLNAHRRGRLGIVSYSLLILFLSASVFIYLLDLAQTVYFEFSGLSLTETYGFWASWVIYGMLTVTIIFSFFKTVEDFWLMLIGVFLSIIAYDTFVAPLFLSSPFAFFANNIILVGIRTSVHIKIVSIALVIAIFTGVPIGVYITRHENIAKIVLYIASIVITIPSIALFGFMMPILSSIDELWDAVAGIGIGTVPAVIALALYSELPIIRNTYIALRNVDPDTIEAGRGMGMTNFQLLKQLQLPLAAPVIMAGVRTAVVLSIAIAAIAAFIGAGGLGLFVSEGLQLATNDSVIIGAITMGLLAILADIFLGNVENWITPTGLKIKR